MWKCIKLKLGRIDSWMMNYSKKYFHFKIKLVHQSKRYHHHGSLIMRLNAKKYCKWKRVNFFCQFFTHVVKLNLIKSGFCEDLIFYATNSNTRLGKSKQRQIGITTLNVNWTAVCLFYQHLPSQPKTTAYRRTASICLTSRFLLDICTFAIWI